MKGRPRLVRKPSPAMVVAAIALFAALAGTGTAGELLAAGKLTAKQVGNAALPQAVQPSAAAHRGPRGPRGPQGPRGPRGAPGTALYFAHVHPTGVVDAGNSVQAGSWSRTGQGTYCLQNIPVTIHNAVASVGENGPAIAASIELGAGGCQVRVRTYDIAGELQDTDFFINVN